MLWRQGSRRKEDVWLRTLFSRCPIRRQPYRLDRGDGRSIVKGFDSLSKWLRGPFTVSPLWDHMGVKVSRQLLFFFFMFRFWDFKAIVGPPCGRLAVCAERWSKILCGSGEKRKREVMEGKRGKRWSPGLSSRVPRLPPHHKQPYCSNSPFVTES